MKVYVRPGNPGDMLWMLEQLKEFSVFFGTKISLYEESFAIEGLTKLMDNGLTLIAKRGDQRLGFIVGAITPHLFNPNVLVITELLWWVDPKHRNGKAGYLLLQEFIKWGKNNVDWIIFSLQEKTQVNEETLLKQGFEKIERSYLIEVGCDHGSTNSRNNRSSNASRRANI